MTGPATKAARSARAIPLQPRPSRCRPPAVRRSACPWGSRGRNANASAGHVRDDHQPFNTPSGKRFGNLLIAPDVVEPLPRAPACRRSGTGGRRSRIRHKCRPRKASRSRHARVPEKGPVEGAPVRTLYCSRYGGGNRSRTGLQTGRSARPCVRRPPPEGPTVARSSLSTGSSPQKSPIRSDDAIIRRLAAVRNRRGKRTWLRPKREAHRAHPGGKERILGRSRAEPLTPAPLSLSVTDRNASSTEAHKRIRPSGSQR